MTATLTVTDTQVTTQDFYISLKNIFIVDPINKDRADVNFDLGVRYMDEFPTNNFNRGITVKYVYTNELEQIVKNLKLLTLARSNDNLLQLLQESESKFKLLPNPKANIWYGSDTVECLILDNPPVFTIPVPVTDLQTETMFRDALTIAFLPYIKPWLY